MIFAIVAAVILIADQWLKYWVTVNITLATGSHELLPGVVKLVNIHNSGAAFGLLDNVSYARWIFLAITAAFVVIIALLLAKRVFDSKFAVWCEVLFLTGALGNCIDRVFLGYVVDMFKLDFVNFAVFNIADAVLVVSCLMFVIYVFFRSRKMENVLESSRSELPRLPPLPLPRPMILPRYSASTPPRCSRTSPSVWHLPSPKSPRVTTISGTISPPPAGPPPQSPPRRSPSRSSTASRTFSRSSGICNG